MSTQHLALAQQPFADTVVELFSLDCSVLGGPVYSWTPGPLNGAPLSLAGVQYAPLPIETEGFEWNGRGQLPTPKVRVSNISGLAAGIVIGLGDALGATMTRIRTFAMFLDGQPNADSGALFEPDIFRVERKSKHTNLIIEWELSSQIDVTGLKLPRRQVIRNTCTHTYRAWNGSAFVYGSCPYAGLAEYQADGTPTGQDSLDVCGKRLSDCILRFGANTPLPTRAFPGVAIQST